MTAARMTLTDRNPVDWDSAVRCWTYEEEPPPTGVPDQLCLDELTALCDQLVTDYYAGPSGSVEVPDAATLFGHLAQGLPGTLASFASPDDPHMATCGSDPSFELIGKRFLEDLRAFEDRFGVAHNVCHDADRTMAEFFEACAIMLTEMAIAGPFERLNGVVAATWILLALARYQQAVNLRNSHRRLGTVRREVEIALGRISAPPHNSTHGMSRLASHMKGIAFITEKRYRNGPASATN